MIWNKHSELAGKHAFLSPSAYYWVNDESEQFRQRLINSYASDIGTLLHGIARKYISHGFKMYKQDRRSVVLELIDEGIPDTVIDRLDFDAMFLNLMTYVNDCVGFRMEPEVLLYYSPNCFGTTDAIAFLEHDMRLQIHDYKSGAQKAYIEQLLLYAALFCLEYRVKPEELGHTELRIYQSGEVLIHCPTAEELAAFIGKIVDCDAVIREMKEGGILR